MPLRLSFTVLLAVMIAGIAHADQRTDAAELLEMWQPQSVFIEEGTLTVVLPQDRITQEIFVSVLTSGLCFGILMEKPLDGLSGVAILNRHARQGYVLESGLEDCSIWNTRAAGSEDTLREILGRTHLY